MELSRITKEDFDLIKQSVIDQIGLDSWIPMALRPSFDCSKDEEDDGSEDNDKKNDGGDDDEGHDEDPVHKQLIKDFAPKGKQVDNIFASKIGGHPYIPRDVGKDELDGQDLVIQVNLEDISLPQLPPKGLLQFFVNNSEDNSAGYGGSRILYYPEPDRTVTLAEVREKYSTEHRSDHSPVNEGKCQLMKFKQAKTVNWQSDVCGPIMMKAIQDFYKLTPKINDDGESDYGCSFDYDELSDSSLLESSVDSNIGGWYNWVQDDPWRNQKRFTLFFLDSNTTCYNPSFDCYMWGDVGTGTWTMDADDVMKHDFSKHEFSWDCC